MRILLMADGGGGGGLSIGGSFSSGSSKSNTESVQARLDTLEKELPALISAISSGAIPFSQGLFDAIKNIAPQNVALQSQLADLQTRANTALLQGSGKDYLTQLEVSDRMLNPEFYSAREAAGNKLNQLINSYDLSGLSPAEMSVAERAVNRDRVNSGNLSVGSPIQTVRNAMLYGNEFDKKRAAVNQAIGTANQFMAGATRINPETAVFNNAFTSNVLPKAPDTQQYSDLYNTVLGMSPGSASKSKSTSVGISV